MEQRTRRSPARWLAPLALIAAVVALAAVVTGANDENGGSSTTQAGTTQTKNTSPPAKAPASGTKTTGNKAAAPKTYVVKIGDSLSIIADKTGLTLERLEELNPDVDSQRMTAGQKIRLR